MPADLDERASARVGTELKQKYRLVRLIGSGGMASVYEAVHRNGHAVAVKVLHPHLSVDADLRTRFLREGYVANKVKHRGAVRVIDDDIAEDGSVFLVMELLEGETLEARWRRCGARLPQREVCELACQLLEVLAAAHDKGVVHRDIKPENLFLTGEGVLKVLDFGIARLHETTVPESVTRTGHMIGTPAFMPPEQALGRSRQIDGQTDLWAVGATMFTLMSGRYVHEAETVAELLVFAASHPARPLAAVLPDVPPSIAALVDRALLFGKERRWPDARTMGAALVDAYRAAYGSTLPGSRGSGPPPVDPFAHGRSGAVAAAPVGPTVNDPSFRTGRAVAPTAPAETTGSGTQIETGSSFAGLSAHSSPPSPLVQSSTTAAFTSPSAGSAGERPTQGARPAWRSRSAMWGGLVTVLLLGGGGVAFVVLKEAPHDAITAASAQNVPPTAAASAPPAPANSQSGDEAARKPERRAPPLSHEPSPPAAKASAGPIAETPVVMPAVPVSIPVLAPAEKPPSGLLCYTDPFTGRPRLATSGPRPGQALYPCRQDPFTGAYQREGKQP
jgi:eukaryotic-like serine/threonine-protein kinase